MREIESFLDAAKKPLLVILGPTASGKTELSLKLAKKYQGEIISTDSRQIYREMDISTDSIPLEKQQGVPHHLLGIADPDEVISLAEFKDLALEKIADIHSRNKLPILAGGTGLYISSIIEAYDVPRIPPNSELRKELETLAAKEGNEALHQKLKELDPDAAASIHPNNLPYVIRAIEINLVSGKNKSDHKESKSPFDLYMIGVQRPREEIYKRIERRVDQQVELGLIDEVKALLEKGYDLNSPAMTSLGVKEIIPYINGKQTLQECLDILKRNTRRYAKRQMTWFRRYDNVHWLAPDQVKDV